MSYTGIGATDPNHPLEVEGQVFISNVEAGSASQDVPFEVYSDYTGNSGLTDSRQLRLRVTPSATTTTSVHVDMGINNTDGDYFFISEPVTGATTVGTKSTFTINQDGNVGVGSNLSVTGNVVTSNIVGGSPLTISTGSNVQILTSNVGIGTVVDPVSNTRVHIQGGSHASITNSNVFPNFIFSRNANASLNHVGGSHNTSRHAVFPDEDGKVWSSGAGWSGALGLGDTVSRNRFTLVSALDGVANIVASSTSSYSADAYYAQTMLLDNTGNVWTCGLNVTGQLGHNDTKNRYIPTLVSNSNIYNVSITEVSTGIASCLALDSTGQIWGCGYNQDYRIGNLSGVSGVAAEVRTFTPSMPAGTHVFTSVECGGFYALALEDNGRIWSTGSNANGRAGQGATATQTGWGTVSNAGGIQSYSITQICSGETHSMARDSTGNVWVTGLNANGQLGLGDTTQRTSFTRVTTNVNVESGVTITKIGAGVIHSWALDTAGRMWACGYNSDGQSATPPYITTVNTFVRVDAGPIADKSITDFVLLDRASTLVRTSDNEYYVAGYGGDWALGTGDGTTRLSYTKLLDVNANPPPDYGYTRSLLLENTETGKGPSIELKNSDAVSSRIQMEDGASGKLNIGFVDASFDPTLSGGDGAVLEPFQERAQSNTMTRGVTINQAGGTMVAGGSTSNVGFNTPIVNSGLPGTANYGYGGGVGENPGTIFITTEGKVYFAGNNSDGQAGDGTTSDKAVWIESTPASSYPIVAWWEGSTHNMVLDSAGQLWAAGTNGAGELGLGDTTARTTWTAVSGTGNQAVACGGATSYRIISDQTIQACGYGGDYRLGTGTTANQTSFVAAMSGAMSGQKAKSIWGAPLVAFVIRSDNVLLAVGNNAQGECGVGSTSLVTTWTAVTTTNYTYGGVTETPVQVAGSYSNPGTHTMMITAEGNIYGCGDGAYYKTGLNSTSDVTIFTRCTGDVRDVTVTRVATTLNASICLDSTGNVWTTGNQACTGQPNEDNNTEFTKVTLPAEFLSKTIVNVFGGANNSFYAVDSEGTMWGVGNRIRGLGQVGGDGYNTKLFSKVPIYDIVPKEFKYTPTLTLENPNPDYGATVEFKNPNNRAFINLDDKTSNLRLGFVNNENNAGQFKGISISPSDNSVYFNQALNLVAPGDEGINFRVPTASVDSFRSISKFIGIRDSNGTKMAGIDFTGENDGQKISFYTHDSGVSIGTRMTIYQNGIMQCLNPNARFVNGDATSAVSYGWYTRWNTRVPGLGRFEIINQRGGGPGGIEFGNHQTGGFTTFGDWCPLFAASFNVVSDFRLKRDIQTIENGLDTISRLNPTTFETNMSNEGDDYVRKSGFIAQEVYYDTPELRHALTMPHDAQSDIETNRLPNYENWGNDRASMELAPIIPYLVKAVQELKARVEALENA